jgi:hypothetical protein
MQTITDDKKKDIRNHANRNIAYLLDRLDIRYYDRGDGLIQSVCPCKQHGGDRDNQTAWSWRTDIGKWVCWSHQCQESRGNDIFGLVSSVLGTGFRDTVSWIIETLEEKSINLSEKVADPVNLHRGTTLHIHEPLSEDNLKFLQPDPQYLLNRGFDLDVLRKYEVGLWSRPGTFMHDRVVFPIRDHEGVLIGYTGRTIHPKEYFDKRGIKYAKWVHARHYNQWPSRGDLFTGSLLFNLFRAKLCVKPSNRLILVEGPLDGMKLEEAGIHNWVATLSTSFCHAHRTLLVKYGIKDLFVAYDNDDPNKYKDHESPGEKGWDRMERIVGDIFNLHRVPLPPDSDCGELEVDQLKDIFKDILC